MADWRGVQEGVNLGFQRGLQTGGKMQGLGNIIGKVADRLRSQRETGEALETLGKTEDIKQKIALQYDPEKRFKQKLYEQLEKSGTGQMGGVAGTQGNIQLDALGNLKVINAKEIYENQKAQELLNQAKTSGKSITDIESENKAQEELSKELGKGIGPDKAGLYTLANESIKNIQDIKKILFPTGEAKSFKRTTAFAANLPGGTAPFIGAALPERGWGKAEQDVYRKMGAALSGRQLIQTGVAARPEETQRLVSQFAPSVGSNPESALAGLNELEKFYTDYKNTLKTRGLKANLQNQVKPTGQIMEDANGNKAIVYPDGTYEEMR